MGNLIRRKLSTIPIYIINLSSRGHDTECFELNFIKFGAVIRLMTHLRDSEERTFLNPSFPELSSENLVKTLVILYRVFLNGMRAVALL